MSDVFWSIVLLPFVPDVYSVLKDAVTWLLTTFVDGLMDALNVVLSAGFETFLFFPNPADVQVLDTLWWLSLSILAAAGALSIVYVLLLSQFFPGKDSADLQYYIEKFLKTFIIVFISRPLISFSVAFSHGLTGIYYKTTYDLSIAVSISTQLVDQFGLFVALLWGLLASGVLLVAGVGFIILLVVRMLIVYVTFALLPVLMGFQLVEVGPWSRVNQMGKKFIAASGKLLIFGVFITALIWGSTILTDFDQYDSSGGTFAGGTAEQAQPPAGKFGSAGGGISTLILDFFKLVTPLLVINFLGFQYVMEVI
ncbi:hypothetical protein Hrd1104_11440 [Halorhabdus sp. CBA1104]|uniref:hypothetical protein n=1 Tax=unclassified Halorhabdus TaxID=2621901 RepID=UPI0012B2F125|nr:MULTISPECIES: hypothetical protein [unclassified Halorhabdus]QGN07854.1 hypothetical protein Hrd1104_11440 [Halorhabdus sp. CBA1104]